MQQGEHPILLYASQAKRSFSDMTKLNVVIQMQETGNDKYPSHQINPETSLQLERSDMESLARTSQSSLPSRAVRDPR